MTKKARVLFYAINGIGLGHVVRLAQIASELVDQAHIACYSNSPAAAEYWPGDVYRVDDDRSLPPTSRAARVLRGFYAALARFEPDIVVCDTHWPRPLVRHLHERGTRTVLVLRTLETETMARAVTAARGEFSRVLLPHHPAELLWLYHDRPDLLASLSTAPFVSIGPVARSSVRRSDQARVIVTVGGGGEFHRHDPNNSVEAYLEASVSAAKELHLRLGLEPILVTGPLIDGQLIRSCGLKPVRTNKLHDLFGPKAVVIARGGYNTAWEAIAARAKLVLVGSHKAAEDVGARSRFLEEEGVARHVAPKRSEIVAAGLSLLDEASRGYESYLYETVNSGLTMAANEILGAAYLRDRGTQSFYATRQLAKLERLSNVVSRGWKGRQLRVVRFDDVSLATPHRNVIDLAKLALALGYQVQLHVISNSGRASRRGLAILDAGAELWCHGSTHRRGLNETLFSILNAVQALKISTGHDVRGVSYPYDDTGPGIDDLRRHGLRLSRLSPRAVRTPGEEVCVDVCSWPGPRLRSELALGFAITTFSIDGLCFHADRLDQVPQATLLQMFAPSSSESDSRSSTTYQVPATGAGSTSRG